ncbi:MAG TPA: SDR family oxidoreductase [Fimbriimonas sp.]|nr:SDR family oxidoreductase [Fimbriimonas sp.]
MDSSGYPVGQPAQEQDQQPGIEADLIPQPIYDRPDFFGSGKLKDQVAIITGGDSGIGKAVAIAFAKEGAIVNLSYLSEHEDAERTRKIIYEMGRQARIYSGDIGMETHCIELVEKVIKEFGRIDIIVNNAAEQHPQDRIEDITDEQLERTFRTNVYSHFFLIKAALPFLKPGASIINTTSVTAYLGSGGLIDYAATKGAVVALTRSLALNLADRRIRVNAVAPGPIWTPLIPATFDAEKVAEFGTDTPLGRAGQPVEVAPCFVFLASEGASYMTGQVLHPNGGEIVNG